jgi:hypothetical protein
MRAWEEERSYLEILKEDKQASGALPGPKLDEIFDEGRFLANIGVVFDRLQAL